MTFSCHQLPMWTTSRRTPGRPAPWRRLWSLYRWTSCKTWWRRTTSKPIRTSLPKTSPRTSPWSPWRAAIRLSSWTGPAHWKMTWCQVRNEVRSPAVGLMWSHPLVPYWALSTLNSDSTRLLLIYNLKIYNCCCQLSQWNENSSVHVMYTAFCKQSHNAMHHISWNPKVNLTVICNSSRGLLIKRWKTRLYWTHGVRLFLS